MRRLQALVAAVAAVACSDGEARPAAAVSDSAGIRIVTHESIDGPTWALDSDPRIQLGTVDDGGPQQFFRISAGRRLASGEIAVMDGSREVRVFTEDGVLARSFGREGDGPGEFRGPGRMFDLPGDSLAIWDTRLRRLTISDYEGHVARIVTPDGVGRRPQILTVLPGGSTLFEQEILLGRTPTEFTLTFSDYLLFGPDGALVDSLPRQPRVEVGLWGSGPMAGPGLFDEGTRFAGAPAATGSAAPVREEIRGYSLRGELEVLIRWTPEDRSVGPDASDIALAEELEALGPGVDSARVIDIHRGRAVPDLFPAHGSLEVDRLGHLWVEEFRKPGGRRSDGVARVRPRGCATGQGAGSRRSQSAGHRR